jgi:LPS-assembly lipoprotein
MRRRALLGSAGLVGLAGCGFAPRGAPRFEFERLALVGFAAGSPVREALARALAGLPLQVVTAPQAQVVLEVQREEHSKVAVASTAAGQVREWQLLLQLEYRMSTPGNELLLPNSLLRLTRDLTTTEAIALAKEREEAELRRAMVQDAVSLLMRRLAAIKLGR